MPDSYDVILTRFAGRAGDHNDRAMTGSPVLADALAARLGQEVITIGEPRPALAVGWADELASARPELWAMGAHYARLYAAGHLPFTALSRCAVALATLPAVAAHRPDAVVVWFDAHADLNTPATSTTGYLGGLALSGPLGWWDSGLGAGLRTDQVIVVGARDIDPPEQVLLDDGTIAWVPVGDDLPVRLREAVARRPVYVHLDCDVLEPGLVPTDYRVPGGLDLDQLRAAMAVLAENEVVGVEVGEFESGPDDHGSAAALVAALEPLLPR